MLANGEPGVVARVREEREEETKMMRLPPGRVERRRRGVKSWVVMAVPKRLVL